MGHSSPIFDKNFDAIFLIVSHTRLIHSTCATRLSRKRGFEVFLVTEAAKRGLTIAVDYTNMKRKLSSASCRRFFEVFYNFAAKTAALGMRFSCVWFVRSTSKGEMWCVANKY